MGFGQKWKGLLAGTIAAACCMGSAAAAGTSLPILMYHHFTTDSGQVNAMTITQDRFQQDMEYLNEYGFTTLLPRDLVAIRAGEMEMPDRPVMITFDDGYESNYSLAYPVLQQTQTKAAIALVTSHIRDMNDLALSSSLSWEQVTEMHNSGLVEFGSHTHALHNEDNHGLMVQNGPNGVWRHRSESRTQYNERVGTDILTSLQLIATHTGVPTTYFAYPYGEKDPWIQSLLNANGVKVTVLTTPETADIQNGLMDLTRFTVNMGTPIQVLLHHSVQAQPSVTRALYGGKLYMMPTYLIEGKRYVKLRDVGHILQNTPSRFAVSWDGSSLGMMRGMTYVPDGSELGAMGTEATTGASMAVPFFVDGKPVSIAAYKISGNHYFSLDSLSEFAGFGLSWDNTNGVVTLKPGQKTVTNAA